jgi:uncharacterized damage-inducible protein DinB
MNAAEMLDNVHLRTIKALDDLPELQWDIPGVCGNWTVKEIVAHLTSYELALAEAFKTFLGQSSTHTYISRLLEDGAKFNEEEVEKRRYKTAQYVMDEYNEAQIQTVPLLEQIPVEKLQQKGTLPWYNADRSLNDIIITFYNHANEHCAQIENFRSRS